MRTGLRNTLFLAVVAAASFAANHTYAEECPRANIVEQKAAILHDSSKRLENVAYDYGYNDLAYQASGMVRASGSLYEVSAQGRNCKTIQGEFKDLRDRWHELKNLVESYDAYGHVLPRRVRYLYDEVGDLPMHMLPMIPLSERS